MHQHLTKADYLVITILLALLGKFMRLTIYLVLENRKYYLENRLHFYEPMLYEG